MRAPMMFHRRRDASKVALWGLTSLLRERDIGFLDCQVWSSHLASLGARSISRREFLLELAEATAGPLRPDPSWRESSIALPQPFMQNSRGLRGR